MPRRPASVTQADIARAIRAAKKAGADSVKVEPDGSIIVLLKGVPLAPEDAYTRWKREYEQEKASRRGDRH